MKSYLLRISKSKNSFMDSRDFKDLPMFSHYKKDKNADFVKRIILTNKPLFDI
jgi:hypothetical protein